MTDKELMKLAAKAAEIVIEDWTNDTPRVVEMFRGHLPNYNEWNPLTDDGDALRLAVKIEMDIYVRPTLLLTEVVAPMCTPVREPHTGDPFAATRRAIVKAAAKIGKDMK